MIQPLHIDPGALHQQLSQMLVSTLADSQQIGLAAGAVLPEYQAHLGSKVATSSVLLAIAHLYSQQAGGDRTDTWHAEQTTPYGWLASYLSSVLICSSR